jgi:hypothetical protein
MKNENKLLWKQRKYACKKENELKIKGRNKTKKGGEEKRCQVDGKGARKSDKDRNENTTDARTRRR